MQKPYKKRWRYRRGNHNPYIKEGQTTQWSKEKVQKDNQRSTKHTHKTKDRVTRTPLKTGGELRCSGRESSSCSTSDTRRVNLITNPVEWCGVSPQTKVGSVRKVVRYQREFRSHKSYVEGQTIQWSKQKVQTTIYKTIH